MYKYLDIPGWFNMHDALMNLVRYCEDGDDIVEIGCFAGRSTRFLCDALELSGKHDVKVHVIDTFEGSGQEHATVNCNTMYDDFMRNLHDHIEAERVIVNVNKSDNQNILDFFDDKSVFGVIVDGNHTYDAVKQDIINWWPKIKDGGIMVGDDVSLESVKQAAFDGFAYHGINTYNVCRGVEGWFSQIKNDRSNEVADSLKLVPGQNCMRLDG
tara:strand:- start:34 stop:672 length:639 start_codon:yes stop_codon:yes gene_type:complete